MKTSKNLERRSGKLDGVLKECIKANYTVKTCLEAGYKTDDFEKIGFNRLHVVSGFNEEDLASIGVFRNGTTCRELKEAGWSLEQCGEAGYTVKMCLEAGYTKNDFKTGLKCLRLTQEDLVYIGVALDETGCRKLKEEGFSLEQCGKAGYTVKMCLKAGYTKNDFDQIGFKDLASIAAFMNVTGCRELKEAGFSLEQCGKAGYTVKMCLEAEYTMDNSKTGLKFLRHFSSLTQEDLVHIGVALDETGCRKLKEAGLSLEQCGKAGYTVKMCLKAGYTKNDFDQIGFNRLHVVSGFNEEDLASIGVFRNGTTCRELKEAGWSLEQCGEAGYTVKMCLEAGYSWFEGLGLGRDTSLDLESNGVWQ